MWALTIRLNNAKISYIMIHNKESIEFCLIKNEYIITISLYNPLGAENKQMRQKWNILFLEIIPFLYLNFFWFPLQQ